MLSRRRALGLGAAAAASALLAEAGPIPAIGPAAASPTSPSGGPLIPPIRPRSDWAGELAPVGELVAEDDVRFLLVHHTASTNDYGPDDVTGQLRDFYTFHTSAEKGWPDIAYNFLIDRFGGIWEGRAGSIAGPVRGDATGGSQGFALLCSLIGNHAEEPMTEAARSSLVQLLAWLGATYGIDTAPGSTVSFRSRGSSRWPEGADVEARTISGHRDMSTTTCPGEFVYTALEADLPAEVWALQGDGVAPEDGPASSTTTDGAAADSTTSELPGSDPPADPTTTSAATDPGSAPAGVGPDDGSTGTSSGADGAATGQAALGSGAEEATDSGGTGRGWALAAATGTAAAAGGAMVYLNHRAGSAVPGDGEGDGTDPDAP